jgi:DNA topoisomerase-2
MNNAHISIQVTKGNQKINFFTIPEFQKWNEENNKDGKWYVKYYKVSSKRNPSIEYTPRLDTVGSGN